MSTLTYRVAWPYANVRIIDPATGTTTVIGLAKGGHVPPSADPQDVKRLVAKGALEAVEAAPVPAPEPAPEPAKKITAKPKSDS